MRRIGVLMSTAETDPLETVSLAAFNEELAKLGWTTSQNVTIDVRWGAADAKSDDSECARARIAGCADIDAPPREGVRVLTRWF